MNTIDLDDPATVTDLAAGRQPVITRPEPAPVDWVGQPLGIHTSGDPSVTAVVGLLECLPIRPYQGCVDPPTGRWVGITDEGRIFVQECDGMILSTSIGFTAWKDRCDWTVGRWAWMFT